MLSNVESNIPINEKSYYIIKESGWSNSIDIIIKENFNFNVVNLFFIFKSYFRNDEIFVKSLYLCVNTKESEIFFFTYKKINFYGVDRFKIDDFIKWLNSILDIDKEYIINAKFYGFRIVLYEFSPILIDKKIYPQYPWKDPYFEEIKDIQNLMYIDLI